MSLFSSYNHYQKYTEREKRRARESNKKNSLRNVKRNRVYNRKLSIWKNKKCKKCKKLLFHNTKGDLCNIHFKPKGGGRIQMVYKDALDKIYEIKKDSNKFPCGRCSFPNSLIGIKFKINLLK